MARTTYEKISPELKIQGSETWIAFTFTNLLEAFVGGRHADEAAAEAGHEIDRRRRDVFGGQDEIALVLTVGVIDDDDHASPAEIRRHGIHRIEDSLLHAGQVSRKRPAGGNKKSPFAGADGDVESSVA